MARKMTKEEEIEYDRLTARAEQIQLQLNELVNRPVVYGYVRVSSKTQARDGNSLEVQEREVKNAGASIVYTDVYTGTTTDRPEFDKLLSELKKGDTIVVTKLDRIARNLKQGLELVDMLNDKGVKVNVLNMGLIDDTPTGRLIRNIMLSLAEWERDMIMQRTREGREQARRNPDYREGRKPKYTKIQLDHAMELLEAQHTYTEVVEMTKIS